MKYTFNSLSSLLQYTTSILDLLGKLRLISTKVSQKLLLPISISKVIDKQKKFFSHSLQLDKFQL